MAGANLSPGSGAYGQVRPEVAVPGKTGNGENAAKKVFPVDLGRP